MSTDLTAATRGSTIAAQPANSGRGAALAMPGGTGAVGQANLSMVRMATLLEQARKSLLILQDVSSDLRAEVVNTADIAESLTASFGERISLEQLVVIANMLGQIAEGSIGVVAQGGDAVSSALVSNYQVLVAQDALHSLGADGAYVDSQRRLG